MADDPKPAAAEDDAPQPSAPAADETTFKEYVLTKGNKHYAIVNGEGKQLVGGDRLKLSPNQAQAFSDKFREFKDDEDADSEKDASVPGPARESQTATGEPLTDEDKANGLISGSTAPPPAPANADPNASNVAKVDPVGGNAPGAAASGVSAPGGPAPAPAPAATAPASTGSGSSSGSSSSGSGSSGGSSGGSGS